ncbi:MAG TPA: 3-oxoacyl-ACP synthase, partial [Flavobacteriaceae bacterium]|nr:3-oxoacyl-ACP synthase [Flavobacteriaceae bacterium]
DKGIIAHKSASFTYDEVKYLFFGGTYDSESPSKTQYIKMYGRKIYNFALTHVPDAMKACLDESGYNIQDIKK